MNINPNWSEMEEDEEDDGDEVVWIYNYNYQDDEDEIIEPEIDTTENIHKVREVQQPDIIKRLNRGEFGPLDDYKLSTAQSLRKRMIDNVRPKVMSRYLPNCHVTENEKKFHDTVYAGGFSKDGTIYWSCCKDLEMRLYDTTNVYKPQELASAELSDFGQWTLTDGTISSDNENVVFTTMSSNATLYNIKQDSTINLAFNGNRAIFSVEFSPDDTNVIAGLGDGYVKRFDLNTMRVGSIIGRCEEDVNCVTYLDNNPNLILSGSDDTKIVLWDQRQPNQEALVFLGHTEGVTGLDSKKDGRYFISNSKDQALKLWDLRQGMTSNIAARRYGDFSTGYDYRWEDYRGPRLSRHPDDGSIMTYGGHEVIRTLIRCYFSPEYTGRQYIYSASADGYVYIWHIDGTLKEKINTEMTLVRDVSWHPRLPNIYCAGQSLQGGLIGMVAHSNNFLRLNNLTTPHVF